MNDRSAYFCARFRKFAVDTISFAEGLRKYHKYVILDQITRSVTSIGANFYESRVARSRRELVGILGIALRETKETEFWLDVIEDLNLLSRDYLAELKKEESEIAKILFANIRKNKQKLNFPVL